MKTASPLHAGLDLGTSGCRLKVLDSRAKVVASAEVQYPATVAQTPELWWQSTQQCLAALPPAVHASLAGIAVDGTSGTILLTDADGNPTSPALMYNDNRAREQAARIQALAPQDSAANGAGSSLARLLWLLEHYPDPRHAHALHQADWVAGKLSGQFGFSDENNCLKLGYDPLLRQWPDWLAQLVPPELLPLVHEPGQVIPGAVYHQASVHAGTTDSIAAFLATGASEVGDAVTSLGSTLVLKILCEQPVFAREYGIYSHRLGDRWLAGGASNTGGAVLLQYFSREQLQALTPQLRLDTPTTLAYYPLPAPGERFPVNDPDLPPRLSPRPDDDAVFLQGLLEAMSRIEHQGWQKLHALGAPYPRTLRTVGGGSGNPFWTACRERYLGMSALPVQYADAACGAALLAGIKR